MKFNVGDLFKSAKALVHLAGYSLLLAVATSASFWVGGLFGGIPGIVIGVGGTGLFTYGVYPILKENWDDFTSGLSGFAAGLEDRFNPKRERRLKENLKKRAQVKKQAPKIKEGSSMASLLAPMVSLFGLLKRKDPDLETEAQKRQQLHPSADLTGENLAAHAAEVTRRLRSNELRNTER